MKKEKYLINVVKNGAPAYRTVNGYTEILTNGSGDFLRIGYHYDPHAGQWIATEIFSGFKCGAAERGKKTDVITYVHSNAGKIFDAAKKLIDGAEKNIYIKRFRTDANAAGLNQPYAERV